MPRPRKIKSPEEFDRKVDEYISRCEATEKPITWTGLALSLDLNSRQAIDQYLTYDGFKDSVLRAKLLVECAYEQRLHGNSPTGAIFALKNMNWTDKQEREISGPGGGPIETRAVELTDDQLAAIAATGSR